MSEPKKLSIKERQKAMMEKLRGSRSSTSKPSSRRKKRKSLKEKAEKIHKSRSPNKRKDEDLESVRLDFRR